MTYFFFLYSSCHTSHVLFLPDSTSTPNRNLLFSLYYSFLSLLHEVGFYVWLNHHLFLLLLYYYPSTSLCLSLSNRKKVNRKPEILAALGAVVVADPLVVGKWWGKQPNGLASMPAREQIDMSRRQRGGKKPFFYHFIIILFWFCF